MQEAVGEEVLAVAVPQHGGSAREVVTGDAGGVIRVLDVHDHSCKRELLGHEPAAEDGSAAVHALVFTGGASHETVASGGHDSTVRIWHIGSGSCNRVLTGHHGPVLTLASVPNAELLVSGGADGVVHLWAYTRMTNPWRTLVQNGASSSVCGLGTTTPSEEQAGAIQIVAGHADGKIRVWRESGNQQWGKLDAIQPVPTAQSSECGKEMSAQCVVDAGDALTDLCTASSRYILAATTAGDLRAWDTWTLVRGDGRDALHGQIDDDHDVHRDLDDVKSRPQPSKTSDLEPQSLYTLHLSELGEPLVVVHGLAVSVDNLTVLSACSDGRVRLHDILTGVCSRVLQSPTRSTPGSRSGSGFGSGSENGAQARAVGMTLDHACVVASYDSVGLHHWSTAQDDSDEAVETPGLPGHLSAETLLSVYARECKSGPDTDWPILSTLVPQQNFSPLLLRLARTGDTIVHSALRHPGGEAFLRHFLPVPEPDLEEERDASDSSLSNFAAARKCAAALLMRTRAGESSLALAADTGNGACVQFVLEWFRAIVNNDGGLDGCEAEQRLSDLIRPEEVVHALEWFPLLVHRFLRAVELQDCHQRVQGNFQAFRLPTGKSVVLGSDIAQPQDFWPCKLGNRRVAERYRHRITSQSALMRRAVPVCARWIPFRDLAAHRHFLSALVASCRATNSYTVFDCNLLRCMVSYKWRTHTRRYFLWDLVLYTVFVVAFSGTVLFFRSGMQSHFLLLHALTLLVYVVTWLLWLYFLWTEGKQLQVNLKHNGSVLTHFSDVWNVLDVVMLLTVMLSLILLAVDHSENEMTYRKSTNSVAVALPAIYAGLGYYWQGFQQSGILIRMILGISLRIRDFALLLLVLIVPFALSFHVLIRAGTGELQTVCGVDAVDEYASVGRSIQSVFNIMMGDFDTEIFSASSSFGLMSILFVIFIIVVPIVLLNLLIAIMGDKYDEVQENAIGEWLYSLANLIVEFETTRPVHAEDAFPRYLQVLEPVSSQGEADGGVWGGKVREIKKEIEAVHLELRKLREDQETQRVQSERILRLLEATQANSTADVSPVF